MRWSLKKSRAASGKYKLTVCEASAAKGKFTASRFSAPLPCVAWLHCKYDICNKV